MLVWGWQTRSIDLGQQEIRYGDVEALYPALRLLRKGMARGNDPIETCHAAVHPLHASFRTIHFCCLFRRIGGIEAAIRRPRDITCTARTQCAFRTRLVPGRQCRQGARLWSGWNRKALRHQAFCAGDQAIRM